MIEHVDPEFFKAFDHYKAMLAQYGEHHPITEQALILTMHYTPEHIKEEMHQKAKELNLLPPPSGYTSTGTTELWWEALHLPENDFINSYGVADAGADNGGSYEEDSPLYYSYDSSLDVINNGAAYFPLKVTYQGEKPTEDYDQIRKVNYSKLFHFNAIKKEYK